jgi:lipopolysaccharide/colanic/teichoic acid biosynthesis glycosyltransferase
MWLPGFWADEKVCADFTPSNTCFVKGNIVAIDPNQAYLNASFIAPSDLGHYARFSKRAFDILIVVVLALPTLCILILVTPFIALSGGNNVFYKQERIGKDGRIFLMWKLRSMVPDAKHKLEEHLTQNPEARKEWDHSQKLKNDPRITMIGRIIRKTSIDELPQFWNVLLGDMSIVGPRPMMVEQRSLYPGKEYYFMLPGITGFWQTSDRNECSFAQRAYFDRLYYHEMSLLTDLKILYKTVCVVIKPNGC